jgi:hypothetical protein
MPVSTASFLDRIKWTSARCLAGNGNGAAVGAGDFAVGRHGELQDHMRTASLDAPDVARMHPPRLLGADTDLDHDAGLGHAPVAGARDLRIGIDQRGHHARNPSADDRIRTGRRLSVMRAGLERDIERRPARGGTGAAHRLGLGVGPPAGLSPAAAHNHPIFHDDRPHGRVRPGAAEAAAAERERERHEAGVFRAIHGRRRSMRLALKFFRAAIIPMSATHTGSVKC